MGTFILFFSGMEFSLPFMTYDLFGCAGAFIILAKVENERGLYIAATLLAVTSSTVVTGLNSLSSFEASCNERGGKLGNRRSFGQAGRAIGPVLFCTLYWWAGRDMAYFAGAAGMFGVCGLVLAFLKNPIGLKLKPTYE